MWSRNIRCTRPFFTTDAYTVTGDRGAKTRDREASEEAAATVQEEVIRQSKNDNSLIHSFIHSMYLRDNFSDPNPGLGTGTCWTSQRVYNITGKATNQQCMAQLASW